MTEQSRPKVGLALGGGVVRGIAHVGVLSILEQAGIPIDYVAGTSAGSIIGAAYCAGLNSSRLEELGRELKWWRISKLVWPREGFLSFAPLEKWLINQIGDLDFKDLKTPFAAMASDLRAWRPHEMITGRVASAVHASAAVPGVVVPVRRDGLLLGDGCLTDTVPVSVLKRMGADYVIGVDIFTPGWRPRFGPFGMGITALEILLQRAGGGINLADCMICPQLTNYTYIRFSKSSTLLEAGKQAALQLLPKITSDLGLQSMPVP